MKIYKEYVHSALAHTENVLFGSSRSEDMNVPKRLLDVLAEAYVKDFRPECSIILIESYKLLCKEGHYYTHEESDYEDL